MSTRAKHVLTVFFDVLDKGALYYPRRNTSMRPDTCSEANAVVHKYTVSSVFYWDRRFEGAFPNPHTPPQSLD